MEAKTGNLWGRVLSAILIIIILGALGMLGYVIAIPEVKEPFTEFYVLGLDGKATNYPRELVVREEGSVIVGIINREHETVTYRIEVVAGRVKIGEVGSMVLENDEGWEEIVSFIPQELGVNQKVEFLLYKQPQTEVYQSFHLWVDVSQ